MQKLKFKFMFVIAVLFVAFCCQTSFAQETVSPEKQALIREYWEISGGRKLANETFDLMSGQEQSVPKPLLSLVEQDKTLTALQKQELRQLMAENAERINKRFIAAFKQRFDIGQLIEEITIQTFDKFLTENELRELIAFYRTPTGQKVMSVLPKLVADITTHFGEKHGIKIRDFINETMEAELTQLKQNLRKGTAKKTSANRN